MKCSKCEQVKPDYYFFSFRGNYLKDFFANPQALNGQCFDCNGPYKCICCGAVQESTQFRVNGRVCETCKSAGIHRPTRSTDAFLDPFAYGDSLNAKNSAESEDTP